MAKYSLSQSSKTDSQLQTIFDKYCDSRKYPDLPLIFRICLGDRSKFVEINSASSDEDYIRRWIDKYTIEFNNLPHNRVATPKTSCNDPALSVIVGSSGLVTSVEDAETAHVLFMSAENIQGKLLEEYIAGEIRKFGFIWCMGSVMRAADFSNTAGTCIIQVKNKNNTENSSSAAIRDGTNIKHWFRLSTSTKNGKKLPVYHWEELNLLINDNKTENKAETCSMTETKYQLFIKNVVSENKKIICSE